MTGRRTTVSRRLRGAWPPALLAVGLVGRDVSAAGVGGATWTPSVVVTTLTPAGFLVPRYRRMPRRDR